MPALIRKIYLGKCLQNNDWEAIKSDLNKNPIEGVDGNSLEKVMLLKLNEYGIKKGEIEIWGSGKPRREFLWSEDMADACVFLLESKDFGDLIPNNSIESRNTHINIGTGIDISIKELAETIKNCIAITEDLNLIFQTRWS